MTHFDFEQVEALTAGKDVITMDRDNRETLNYIKAQGTR